MLVARVLVNTVNRGDIPVLRDVSGRILVPMAEFAQWGLTVGAPAPVTVAGEYYVDVASIPGIAAKFDPDTVTLEVTVVAAAFSGTRINLGPVRRAGTIFPTDNSVFLNYGFNANGDESFGRRQYQFATEFAARAGNWLFYNTTSQQWGEGPQAGFARLLTNAQYDDRPNLRRLTLGDFFTPGFDLAGSVPMGGASLSKFYSMDPYFVQYPTAAFSTEVAFPSTVQVRIDGNLIAQRQVQPGPVDITNITSGITGGQGVSVVIRDPFGREQVLQQPFFFATNLGLAEGLHEYSYNLGFLRRDYGFESNDYADLAASGFHRYAFTNQLTAGLRGQATRDIYNLGGFGTYQSPLGILGGGASIGGRSSDSGPAASVAYSYTGNNFSFNLGTLYRSRDYVQLSDLLAGFRIRANQYVSGSLFSQQLGTLTATYNGLTSYDGPEAKIANVTYSRGMLQNRGLLTFNYVRTMEPQTSNTWQLSFRYFFDLTTSLIASVGGSGSGNSQALTLQRIVPQGEGVGYELTAGRFDGDAPDAMFGRAFVQANAAHVTLGAEYARASRAEAGPGLARLFVSGSLGAVDGRFFVARPVQDSFAVVSTSGLEGVPVYANGWYAGKTNASGEVVATNLASYYDNFISFGTRELPLDYVFESAEKVISPPTKSGTMVSFAVRKNRAIVGRLLGMLDGTSVPLEFREIVLQRGDTTIKNFTARRGEFYIDGIDPGVYVLRQEAGMLCTARIEIPESAEPVTDVGTVICQPASR